MNLLLKIAFIGEKKLCGKQWKCHKPNVLFFLILFQFNLSEPSTPTVLHFFPSVI